MSDFKKSWDLQMALAVMQSETIDSALWAEAAKWLMLFGPTKIRDLLQQASIMAMSEYFPALKPKGYNDIGEPCYDIMEIAGTLGISVEDAAEKLKELELVQGIRQLFKKRETHKLQ